MNEEVNAKEQASALGWSFLGSFSRQGVTFMVSIVLAWLLSPADFGLVGMAMAFIGIAQLMVDGGFSKALIQAKTTDAVSYDSVFYFNLAVGLGIMLLLQLLAPSIGRFYENDTVVTLIRWLSVLVPINATGVVHQAIFIRTLRFKELAIRSFFAGVTGGVVGLVMALSGFGVYALVGQTLTGGIFGILVLWWAADWRPGRQFSRVRLKEISGFGRFAFATTMLGRSISEIYALSIAGLFSPATLGFFTRSQSLSQLVIRYTSGVVMQVYLPVFSKLQDQEEKFRELFFRVAGLTAWGTFLLTGILMLGAELLIVTLLGEKWLPSVRIFQVMMFSFFNFPINSLLINAMMAKGLVKRHFYYGMVRSVIRLTPLLVAWAYGFEAFLYAFVISSYAGTLMNNWLIGRDVGFSFWRQIREFYRWLLVLAVAMLPAVAVYYYLGQYLGAAAGARWVTTLSAEVVFLLLYLGFSRLLQPSLQPLVLKFIKPLYRRINPRT